MENEKIVYKCTACKKEKRSEKGGKVPICCEREMVIEPLPKEAHQPRNLK